MHRNTNIPVASVLVVPGDPKLKAHAQKNYSVPSHIEELNNRIDELENAIGQDNSGPIGRAYAIRAEATCDKDSDATIGHLKMKKEFL